MDRPPPPQPPPSETEGRHLRSEARDSMFLLATIKRASGAELAVKVRNLSPGGLMAECSGGFVRGEIIHIELRGIGLVAGKIAWTAHGRIGVQFEDQIDHHRARVTPGSAPRAAPHLRGTQARWSPARR